MMKRWIQVLLLIASYGSMALGQGSGAFVGKLVAPNGLALNAQGELYVSDIATHRILKLDRRGRWLVVAGTGEAGFAGDGGPAIQAQLHAPHDLLFDAAGDLIIADSGNHRIRRIDSRGLISTIAGDGKQGRTGYNDPVSPTSLNYPQSLALDREGRLYIADTLNHVVRKLDQQGKLTVFAGTVAGYAGDGGPATKAQVSLPMAVAVAADGSVYISDAGNSRIRCVAPDGTIRTIAGYGPAQDTYGGGYGGDGLPAEKGKLFSATDLKVDAAGNLFIVDSGNHRLRAIRKGVIATVAGTGKMGFTGDGKSAPEAELNTPQKVAIAGDGSLFLSDRANQCIRRIDVNGVITTLTPDRGTR